MKLIKTESGSFYELDEKKKLIRRLEGKASPTPRQGPDGEWKRFADLVLSVGYPMSVIWEWSSGEDPTTSVSDKLLAGSIARSTVTSRVIECSEIVDAVTKN